MLLSGKDIMIDSEIWDKVINWVRSWLGWFPGEQWLSLHLAISLQELERSGLGWNNPLAILVLSWVPHMTKLFRNGSLVSLRGKNIVVYTEIWHEVVHWV